MIYISYKGMAGKSATKEEHHKSQYKMVHCAVCTRVKSVYCSSKMFSNNFLFVE